MPADHSSLADSYGNDNSGKLGAPWFAQSPTPNCFAAELSSFTADPLADFNAVQHELDQLNTELGFLHPHAEREDLGKFTQEGRYRVWKEIWMLNYLGRAARYE